MYILHRSTAAHLRIQGPRRARKYCAKHCTEIRPTLLQIPGSTTDQTRRRNKCLKIYRKSVLHLFKYTVNLYFSRCSTDLRLMFGHPVTFRTTYNIQLQPVIQYIRTGPLILKWKL